MDNFINIWDNFWKAWIKQNPSEFNLRQMKESNNYLEFNKEIIDNKIVVEIGCGIGRVAKRIAINTKKYYGFDISPFAIKIAQEVCPYKTEFITIMDETLNNYQKWLNESVDTVIVRQVFIHLGNELIRKYLNFTYNILRLGGMIEATFYYHPTKKGIESGIINKNVIETGGEVILFTKEDIENLYKESNLTIIFIEYTNERYLVRAVKE